MRQAGPNIFEIDSEPFGQKGLISAWLVRGKDSSAIIDPGFPHCADVILSKMKQAGIDPGEIKYILLTHFHIDHSGAVGALLKAAPKASVVSHKRGVFYIRNFGKVVGGAKMVFGTEFPKRFGDTIPFEPGRVMSTDHDEAIDLGGGVKLRVIYTPGHSNDHVSYLEASSGCLFSGDLACLKYPALNNVYIPAGSPPLYDLDAQLDSLRRVAAAKPDAVLSPHFGETGCSAAEFAERAATATENVKTEIEKMFRQGLEFNQMVEKMRMDIIERSGRKEAEVPEFLRTTWLNFMLKTGLMGYMAFMLKYAPYPRSYTLDTPGFNPPQLEAKIA